MDIPGKSLNMAALLLWADYGVGRIVPPSSQARLFMEITEELT